MHFRNPAALAAAAATLALPAMADAHVTLHPNVIPQGAYAVVNVRVPNEEDAANTTKIAVQMPDGFTSVSTDPPPGWKATEKKTKLDTPIKTEDGEITEQVSEVDFTGGKIPPGGFVQFPLSVAVPGKAGDTLTFKALQTYSNGEVVRWIGPPGDDHPAPTITVSGEGGLIQDSTGEGAPKTEDVSAPAAATTIVRKEKASNGLAIVALIVGALGLAVGATGLSRGRRA